jgi:hypothetical protein
MIGLLCFVLAVGWSREIRSPELSPRVGKRSNAVSQSAVILHLTDLGSLLPIASHETP